jgi:hypothetical protein
LEAPSLLGCAAPKNKIKTRKNKRKAKQLYNKVPFHDFTALKIMRKTKAVIQKKVFELRKAQENI